MRLWRTVTTGAACRAGAHAAISLERQASVAIVREYVWSFEGRQREGRLLMVKTVIGDIYAWQCGPTSLPFKAGTSRGYGSGPPAVESPVRDFGRSPSSTPATPRSARCIKPCGACCTADEAVTAFHPRPSPKHTVSAPSKAS
jgi:hypothetical protein